MSGSERSEKSYAHVRDAALSASPFAMAGVAGRSFPPLPELELEGEALRLAAVEAARPWLEALRRETREEFDRSHEVFKALRQWSDALDRLLAWLLGLAHAEAARQGSDPALALVAVGGYGRRELFPFSDVDLLFLHAPRDREKAEPLVHFVCYSLWDLGLAVGQAVRTPAETAEAAKAEHQVLTALLDARLISGERKLLTKALRAMQAVADAPAIRGFTEMKLAERDLRHQKHGNSRYLLEPHVKDGKGGLRDLHTLYWIARYAYGIRNLHELVSRDVLTPRESRRFRRAFEFLSTVRFLLHEQAGKAEERLTFDMQLRLAEALGFRESEANRSVERFMKRYFQVAGEVGSLTGLIGAALEEHHRRAPKRLWDVWRPRGSRHAALSVEGGKLRLPSAEELAKEPQLLIELFRHALEEELDIHPYALQAVSRHLGLVPALRRDAAANAAFLSILLSKRNPEESLRRMREVGLLGRFLPDFGRITGQMQFDMFHIYTVDEHILRAIGILHRLEEGKYHAEMPIASDIVSQLQSRRVLYLAALCHDIAKGRGDHALRGARIARALAQRFGLNASEADHLAWLVEHHQAFSDTATKRDLTDHDTVRQFAALVQSLERLRLLLVLTVIDMQAVGPHIWNGWKAALLRELYRRTEAMLRTGAMLNPAFGLEDGAAWLNNLQALLPDALQEAAAGYARSADAAFLASLPLAEHAEIVRRIAALAEGGGVVSLDLAHDSYHDSSRLILVAPDRPGLLADVSGALAWAGLSVVSARITTLPAGIALQLLQVQDLGAKAIGEPGRAEEIEAALIAALSASETSAPPPERLFDRRTGAFETPLELFFENGYSSMFTILEITAPDRAGLLYRLTRLLSDEGINIFSAHIGTYGERAVDVFYVKDRFGMKIEHPGRIRELREKLVAALE